MQRFQFSNEFLFPLEDTVNQIPRAALKETQSQIGRFELLRRSRVAFDPQLGDMHRVMETPEVGPGFSRRLGWFAAGGGVFGEAQVEPLELHCLELANGVGVGVAGDEEVVDFGDYWGEGGGVE